MALHAVDICAGYGGLSLGLRLAGVNVRTVAYVERETHAAATLVARMVDKTLDQAPIWDDVTTFPADEFYGYVDIVTGGIPCQPFSAAGQQQGLEDERWLWPDVWSVVQRCGAEWLFLENVPQFRRQGLDAVLVDLSESGWDAEWGLLSAADVDAPHKRERLWLLAHTASSGRSGQRVPFRFQGVGTVTAGCGEDVGDTENNRRTVSDTGRHETQIPWPPRPDDHQGWAEWIAADGPRWRGTWNGTEARRCGEDVADTEGFGEREPDHKASTNPRQHARLDTGWRGFPPHPDDHDAWAEWIAADGPQPSVRRSVDGVTGRLVRPNGISERLHLLGNGVVPESAAVAFLLLHERLTR